jgi:formylglycine-generating enzyme required for sulfatase activity
MARYEVTVAQYSAFIEATGYSVGAPAALQGSAEFPVGSVSWTDALAYSRWLERSLRSSSRTPSRIRDLLEDGWRITLPSETEWEKAARGSDGRIYSSGDTLRPDRARYASASPVPVGSYLCPECPYGLADMIGNVWEWTRSPFTLARHSPEAEPLDLEADALWIMKGGSYADEAGVVRAAVRGGADPASRRPFLGFRLAIVRAREITIQP